MLSDARRSATLLGALGLLPFVAGALAAVFGSVDLRGPAAFALAAYGATIVAFLGAVHWGFVLRQGVDPRVLPGPVLAVGAVPQLAAWVALLLPVRFGLIALAVLVVALLAFDRWSVEKGLAPRWWMPLRVGLSSGAGVCLLLAGLFT